MTELQCAACVMTLPPEEREGPGHEPVADREAAAEYSRILGRAVEVGEQLKEGPCVPPHWLAKIRAEQGRECPRVVLMPQNYVAHELAAMLFCEETRSGAFVSAFEAHLGEVSAEERVSVMRRVNAAIMSPEVQRRLHPPPESLPARRRR